MMCRQMFVGTCTTGDPLSGSSGSIGLRLVVLLTPLTLKVTQCTLRAFALLNAIVAKNCARSDL